MPASFKKIILATLSLPNKIYNRIIFAYKDVSYVTFPTIRGRLFISGSGSIKIGSGVTINSGLFYNPIGGDTRCIFVVYKDAILQIGDYTGMSNVAISCKKQVKIGSYVKIGGSVKIYDSDFHALDPELRKSVQTDIPKIKSVELKDGCFIGAHSIILKGVCIGKNSIIAAGSVVTKSVPDGEIWGGNPIRFIRKI